MKKYIFIAVSALLMSSCSKFLEEYSTDQRYCEKVQDIEDLMIGNGFMDYNTLSVYGIETMSDYYLSESGAANYPWLQVMDDDAEAFAIGDDSQMDYTTNAMKKVASALNMLGNIHYWKPEAYTSVENIIFDDYQWKKIYKHIGSLNSIIYNAENEVTATTDDEKLTLQHLIGEGHFLRAYYYFYLANIYGMPYSEATAQSDFSVPLKISENIEDKYFERNNNAEVWTQIIEDLKIAETNLLGYTAPSPKRVGIGAVEALLSRVYLYMERYDESIAAANAMESLGYTVPDMNKMDQWTSNYECIQSSELVFTMGSNTKPAVFTKISSSWGSDASGNWVPMANVSAFRPSEDLVKTYELGDLRLNFFFYNDNGYTQVRKMTQAFEEQPNNYDMVGDMFILRYAEVLLNKAEALAQKGNMPEARNIIKSLRAKRFATPDESAIPNDGKALVDFIRAERRRELCFESGHRWFDIRRYAVNKNYPLDASFTIKHQTYNYDAVSGNTSCTGYYELPFMSSKDAWVLPAPNYAIDFNRGALTNVLRKERTFVKY